MRRKSAQAICVTLGLLALLTGCAFSPPPVPPVGVKALSAQPGSPPGPGEGSLPPAVVENQTFVTVGGVPQYKIGPGDVLEVLLTRGLTQEKQTVTVKANGMVTVAFFEAKVGGLTTEKAQEEIRRTLSPFYKDLSVEVLVKEYHSKKVTILGAVGGKGGTFPLKGRTTLLDLLAEAGGPASNAALDRVRLLRPDGSSFTVNLFRFLAEEPRLPDLVLDAGDVVFIPARGPAEEPKVFVLGEVRNPGAFPLIPKMRLSQALALAGGPTDTAILKEARVIRGGMSNPQVVEVDFQKVLQGDPRQDLPLETNDLIVLPRSAIGNWNAFIAKIRPTLEVLTLPLALPVQIRVLTR